MSGTVTMRDIAGGCSMACASAWTI